MADNILEGILPEVVRVCPNWDMSFLCSPTEEPYRTLASGEGNVEAEAWGNDEEMSDKDDLPQ